VPVIPAIGLVLVLSVDWFMSMARALGNIPAIASPPWSSPAWEGDIDCARAHQVLNGTGEDLTEAALFNSEPETRQA